MDTKNIFRLKSDIRIGNLIPIDNILDYYVKDYEFTDIVEFVQLTKLLPGNYYRVKIDESAMFLNTDVGVRDNRQTIIDGKEVIHNKSFYDNRIITYITIPNLILKLVANNYVALMNPPDVVPIYHSVNAVFRRLTAQTLNKKVIAGEVLSILDMFLAKILDSCSGFILQHIEELERAEEEIEKEHIKHMEKASMSELFSGIDLINRINSVPTRTDHSNIIISATRDTYYDTENESTDSISRAKAALENVMELESLKHKIDKPIDKILAMVMQDTASGFRVDKFGNKYPIINLKVDKK